jgi:hypothetical protein
VFTPTPILYTLTPAPTLSVEEAQALVSDLLQSNGGCQLPCWWGFTPGETSWRTAYEFFNARGKVPAAAPSVYTPRIYTVSFRVPEPLTQHYYVQEEIIEMIWSNPGDTPRYKLSQLLATYGQPANVWLKIPPSVPEGDESILPFFLLLHYKNQGILVMYTGFTEEQKGQMVICPGQVGGTLTLWASGRAMTLEEIARIGLTMAPNEAPDYLPLTEAVGMSIEAFYQAFTQGEDALPCLEVSP